MNLRDIHPIKARAQEYHITVAGDPWHWRRYIQALNARTFLPPIKALWIELNNFERQLMLASPVLCLGEVEHAGFRVLRVKHEVGELYRDDPQPLYYECHLKIDGKFRADLPMSSRDLYRESRWYLTKRETHPFNPQPWLWEMQQVLQGTDARYAGHEYEACLMDDNPGLDARWQ